LETTTSVMPGLRRRLLDVTLGEAQVRERSQRFRGDVPSNAAESSRRSASRAARPEVELLGGVAGDILVDGADRRADLLEVRR